MKAFHASMTLMGTVTAVDPRDATFTLELLSGDRLSIHVSRTTYYEVLRNIDDDWRDRVSDPEPAELAKAIGAAADAADVEYWQAKAKLFKYLKPELMVCVEGVSSCDGDDTAYSARRVVLMHSEPGRYGWEDTHWWLQQINTLFEQWLDVLFQTRREFTENDFSQFYRTNLDLLGGETGDPIQESATMSRFLYGLSSAYLLTGNERSLSAARACAKYLVNAYASPSHDGEYVFWKFGRVKKSKSTREIIGSLNPEDRGSFPLYEQIYILSGLTQYYRVTQDTWILSYIVRTIAAFEKFYHDKSRDGDETYRGRGGYFSHLDPVTMRPDAPSLAFNVNGIDYDNRAKKNWNSIGDHIPAYLINLIVSIDPLPASDEAESWVALLDTCRTILDRCVRDILDHFRPEEGTLFVKERFNAEWEQDTDWGWQKNRGIVGHNLKISWNLTRCGHYYIYLAESAEAKGDTAVGDKYRGYAEECYAFARELGHNMREAGVDLVRGGIFDALERFPANGLATEFAWGSTKDFWQQEQAILAYYIMHHVSESDDEKQEFLNLARFCSAFWNLFFIDHDNRKTHFRTNEAGEPIIEGQYGIQGGHAIAGYHAFELNYLAHLYIQAYVDRGTGRTDSFVLHYRPVRNSSIRTLNVLPDFFRPQDIEIVSIKVNGIIKPVEDGKRFQVDISGLPEDSTILVEYLPIGRDEAVTLEELNVVRPQSPLFQVRFEAMTKS